MTDISVRPSVRIGAFGAFRQEEIRKQGLDKNQNGLLDPLDGLENSNLPFAKGVVLVLNNEPHLRKPAKVGVKLRDAHKASKLLCKRRWLKQAQFDKRLELLHQAVASNGGKIPSRRMTRLCLKILETTPVAHRNFLLHRLNEHIVGGKSAASLLLEAVHQRKSWTSRATAVISMLKYERQIVSWTKRQAVAPPFEEALSGHPTCPIAQSLKRAYEKVQDELAKPQPDLGRCRSVVADWLRYASDTHYHATKEPAKDFQTVAEILDLVDNNPKAPFNCDDMAHLAHGLLIAAGVPSDQLELGVFLHTASQRHHGVLFWKEEDSDRRWVLDSTGALAPESQPLARLYTERQLSGGRARMYYNEQGFRFAEDY